MGEGISLELVNEILNEYFTQEILKSGGAELDLGTDDDRQCTYTTAIPLMIPFINKYKEKLKHCIMSNDPNEIVEFFGRESLEKLNNILESLTSNISVVDHLHKSIDQIGIDQASAKLYEIAKFPAKDCAHLPEYQQLLAQCFRDAREILMELEQRQEMARGIYNEDDLSF